MRHTPSDDSRLCQILFYNGLFRFFLFPLAEILHQHILKRFFINYHGFAFQRNIEARIEDIEKILKNAEVVVEEEVDLDKISIGCNVKILDIEFDEELEYKIVGNFSF